MDNNDDDDDNAEQESRENKFKFENNFKLEAMKTMRLAETEEEASENSFLSTLESCLAKFTSNEKLSDKIICENCTKKHHKQSNVYTRAVKQYLICELPAILTIHLKRFQQHGFRLDKSNKHVQFPSILDMSSYTSKMCINIIRDHQNQTKPALYTLYGLVEHSGRLNSGHYTAYVKQSNRDRTRKRPNFLSNQRLCHLNLMLKKWNGQSFFDTNNNNLDKDSDNIPNEAAASETDDSNEERWFHISDSQVNEVNVNRVMKTQAYILFYERIE